MITLLRSPRRHTYIFLAIIAVGLIVFGFFIVKRNSPRVSPVPKSTIKQLPQQPISNNGEKKIASSSGVNQGTSTDKQGEASPNTSPNQWIKSASGLLTVKQPVSGEVIKSGFILSGSANLDKVQYRLIDDQRGVVSQGFINVVSGNFSASISFPTYGENGRLDVFSSDPEGREINEVQVEVKLK